MRSNPLGVGFGASGQIASAFLLPRDITVRTLVNSHLTLLVEGGVLIGGAWLAFMISALVSASRMIRTRIAFAGLAASSFSASVFDWHRLFGLGEPCAAGLFDFALSWVLFVSFIAMGIVLIVGGFSARRIFLAASSVAAVLALAVLLPSGRSGVRVRNGFVSAAEGGPLVYHDGEWTLRALVASSPNPSSIRIESGIVEPKVPPREVWLFGDVAELSGIFPDSRVILVDPPQYHEPGANVEKTIRGGRLESRRCNEDNR